MLSMETVYDVLRYLVDHANHPLDDLKQQILDLLDRLENQQQGHGVHTDTNQE